MHTTIVLISVNEAPHKT